jgi:uncharacterized protein
MRRKDKEITEPSEIDSIIRGSSVCRIAVADAEQPYIVPLCFGYDNGTLYFHSAGKGKKIELLQKSRRICFEFDTVYGVKKGEAPCDWGLRFESVIGVGDVSFIEAVADKKEALNLIMKQYGGEGEWDYPESALAGTVVFKIDIESMTGKRAGPLEPSA